MKQPSLHIDPGQNRFWTTCFEPAANETERIYKNSHQSRKSGFPKKKRININYTAKPRTRAAESAITTGAKTCNTN
jgi:hypothetical protein